MDLTQLQDRFKKRNRQLRDQPAPLDLSSLTEGDLLLLEELLGFYANKPPIFLLPNSWIKKKTAKLGVIRELLFQVTPGQLVNGVRVAPTYRRRHVSEIRPDVLELVQMLSGMTL